MFGDGDDHVAEMGAVRHDRRPLKVEAEHESAHGMTAFMVGDLGPRGRHSGVRSHRNLITVTGGYG